jgi:hypothetical protein
VYQHGTAMAWHTRVMSQPDCKRCQSVMQMVGSTFCCIVLSVMMSL